MAKPHKDGNWIEISITRVYAEQGERVALKVRQQGG